MFSFGSLSGEPEDDALLKMMNSFFRDPFASMMPPLMGPPGHRHGGQLDHFNPGMMFGFPPMPPMRMMNDMFSGNMDNLTSGGNCHGMTSTSIMTYTSGPDGRPQIYQESKSTRAAPGGVKEVKESVYDSRSGTKKMAIAHHIGDRAHIIEKKKDLNNGDEEEHQEFINLDDEEAESFNHEWQTHVRGYGHHSNHSNRSHRALENHDRKRHDSKPLALTDGTTSQHSRSRRVPHSQRRNIRPSSTSSRNNEMRGNAAKVQYQNEASTKTSTETSQSRKREHNADNETSNKRHMTNNDD